MHSWRPERIFTKRKRLKAKISLTRIYEGHGATKHQKHKEQVFECESTPKELIVRMRHKTACASAHPCPLSEFSQRGGLQKQDSQHTSIFEGHKAPVVPKTHEEHNFECDCTPKMLIKNTSGKPSRQQGDATSEQ